MEKPKAKKILSFLALFFLVTYAVSAQTKISGTISDAGTKEPLIGVSIQVKGKIIGTITDVQGEFQLSTATPLPFSILISYIGYQTQEIEVSSDNSEIQISLEEQAIMGQEIVVAASRVEETILRSPVAVEKMDLRQIQETPAASFYDGLANLKGVDMTTQGLLFKSVNMRGFNGTGNVRTVQLIDGMDNQAPGLNFPVDNIVGMPELDIESVEILPGASSALYGPNALNGMILMRSKSPFLYQGLSANVKGGVMVANNRITGTTTPFYDVSMRYAKAFNDKWAFKINLAYIAADDWEANDYTNLNVGGVQDGTRGPGVNPDYDGVNIYGDEAQTNMIGVANALIGAGFMDPAALPLIPNQIVSRTGYNERDLVDYNTSSFKTNLALHYRLSEKVEAIAQYNYGYGTTVYTGTGRYSLVNFALTQAKIELRGDNFMIRGYTTQEQSGEAYLAGLASISMLNEWKPHANYFGEYVGAYAEAAAQGAPPSVAHVAARGYVDNGMPQPGSDVFNSSLEKWRSTSIEDGGGLFVDKSNLYHAEGFYNFKNEIEFVDLIVGANVRQYNLRSEGTIFADLKDGRDGTIPISEFGGFMQAGKSLFANHLKLTAAVRYDKNENFEGQFTPRLTAVATFGSQNIRLSYQTGFRIPTTQNQYIDLATPNGTLIGGLPEFDERYNLSSGILRPFLSTASIASVVAANPSIIQNAQDYGIQAITSQALAAVQEGVTAAVTAGATAQITAAVTAGVTSQIQAAVAAGLLANDPAVIAAAVEAGIASTLPLTLADQLPGILAATVPGAVEEQMAGIIATELPGLMESLVPSFALAELPKYEAPVLRPERIESWEIGYKGVIGRKLFVDAYYYQSKYKNFMGGSIILVPTAPAAPGLPIESGIGVGSYNAYSRPANSNETITVKGWAIGADYSLGKGYHAGFNIANNEMVDFTPSAEQQYSGYNTPLYRYNFSFGKRIGSSRRLGFNITFRHQDEFTWQSSFVIPTTTSAPLFSNTQVPATNVFDAQVSYKIPSMKSIIKIGGTNIGGDPYIQAYGSASVGSMYYASITFDQLLNR